MAFKLCPRCKFLKAYSEFNKDTSSPDGHGCYCRTCANQIVRRTHEINKIKNKNQPTPLGCKICSHCGISKLYNKFSKSRGKSSGYMSWCKECRKQQREQNTINNKDKSVPSGGLICTKCGLSRSYSEMCKCSSLSSGYRAHCKKCYNLIRKTLKHRYAYAQKKAKEKEHPWALSFDEYMFLNSQLCYYCDGALPKSRSGLDRRDNEKGYTPDNVVACCGECNRIKSDKYTVDEMLEIQPWLIKCRELRESKKKEDK